MGTIRIIAHSFVMLISFLVDLIDFTLGIQLSVSMSTKNAVNPNLQVAYTM